MDIKNVLLTGGCGLTGRLLAGMLRDTYSVTHLEMKDPDDGLPFIQGDLRSPQAVAKACENMDAVLHVAGLHGAAWNRLGDDVGFEVNVVGTKNILEGAVKAGVKRVVFTSSIWASGHGSPAPPYLPMDEAMPREPAELYGLTKILGEAMCSYTSATSDVSTIVLRPGGILPLERYAPHHAGFLTAAVCVHDVAQAHVLALQAPSDIRHEVFIIAADSPLCQVDPDAYTRDPVGTLDSVVPGAAALVEAGELKLDPNAEWYTVAKAKRVLGYRPQYGFTLE
ncbi:MAG: NAD-dependent epimerase/dehydratase family protein [Victivallales bacterium]|jgi:nucleoside-diphosphate-sugar epimerase|nr:NAD-dependent epimerase/dehydratase family protein [Victivallales bacterium]